jgi:hypothetical protein
MTADLAMLFLNDGPDQACLEYSWVSEGKRRLIQTAAGQHAATRIDVGSIGDASHVQIYAVASGKFGTSCQFPLGPHSGGIRGAIVHLVSNQGHSELIGTAYYADGTSVTNRFQLQTPSVPCPQFSSAHA